MQPEQGSQGLLQDVSDVEPSPRPERVPDAPDLPLQVSPGRWEAPLLSELPLRGRLVEEAHLAEEEDRPLTPADLSW